MRIITDYIEFNFPLNSQPMLGPVPVTIICPTGGHCITTNIQHVTGDTTYIVAAVLCFLLGPIAAVFPFCIDSLKDVEHRCPIDGTVIGVYKRSL